MKFKNDEEKQAYYAAQLAGHKGCPIHGFKYRFHPTSTLCLFPSCLESCVAKLCMKTPSLKRNFEFVKKRDEVEDFVQFVAMSLLSGYQKAKVFALSSTTLWYIFSDWNTVNKKSNPLSGVGMLPNDTDSGRPTFVLGDLNWDEIESLAKSQLMSETNWDGQIDAHRFAILIASDPSWGPFWVDALMGEITPTELFAICRASGMRPYAKPSDVVSELVWIKELGRNYLTTLA